MTANTAAEAFDAALALDVSKMIEPVMVWKDRSMAVALDFDRPALAAPLTELDIDGFMATNAPTPYGAWITHGGGLRVLFTEVGVTSALALALAWLILAPLRTLASWSLEVKTDSRHPRGTRDGADCGRVFTFEPSTSFSFRADQEVVEGTETESWLASRNMVIGGRYDTDLCPWSCGPSTGNPPVSVADRGVHCFRCKRFAPWSELTGSSDGAQLETYRALEAFVHVAHQQLVLLARYPFLTPELIGAGYEFLLRGVHAERLKGEKADEWEERVKNASSRRLDIVRSSSGTWLDARTLDARRVTGARTLKYLPSCFWPPDVERAEDSGPLKGYVAVHPIGAVEVRAPGARPPRGSVAVRRPRSDGDPPAFDLTRRPDDQELEDAWAVLDAAFPGMSHGYHVAVILSMLVAQRGVGTPPFVVVTGQSGSAKTAQLHLGAGAIGGKAVPIELGATEDTNRKIGLALEEGAGAVYVDEIGRVAGLYAKAEPLLSANTTIAYRPKFANERRADMRAAVFLLGSTIPNSIVKSPELARRAVGYRLSGASKVWVLDDPRTGERLDLSCARRDDRVRAALDTVTASVWWTLHDLGSAADWRRLLLDTHNAVELPQLDLIDGDGEDRTNAIRWLYDRYRNVSDCDLTALPGWRGWLYADHGSQAGNMLGALVDMDGDAKRFGAETSDLSRLNLAPILGFSSPHLQLLVRRRGRHTLVKFADTSGLRGHGATRESLPPLGSDIDPRSDDEVTV